MTAPRADSSFGTASTARLRIVSDLHVGEPHSSVPGVDRLALLLEGTDHLVLNGDTLDTRYVDLDPAARAHQTAFAAFAAAHAGRLTVLTGNHDPDLSALHHLDLEDGRVLVTHGDALFPEMAPWGWEAAHFRSEQEKRLAAVPEGERATLETRLRICKEAVYSIRHLSPHQPGRLGHWWLRRFRAMFTLARVVLGRVRGLKWLISYDDVEPIAKLYSWCNSCNFTLGYTAHTVRLGSEIMFFSDEIPDPCPEALLQCA